MSALFASQLSTLLEERKKELLSSLPKEMVEKIQSTSANLAARFTPNPPAKGTVAPAFELQNATGKKVALADLLSENTAVVLTWYRGAWCPYCNIALRALTQANGDIKALGAKLVLLTPETPDESMTTVEKHDLPFEVLSDDGSEVADKYGLAFDLEEIAELYKGIGVQMAEINGNDGKRAPRLPVPATFVLNKKGEIVWSFVDLDYTKRAEPAEIIEAIKSIN